MSIVRLALMTSLAMMAFAGNSLLCRVALSATRMDAASFTTIRIFSGAITLVMWVFLQRRTRSVGGNWWSALALFGYAAGFSFAYLSLSAATGALLLFSAVQCTMIGYGSGNLKIRVKSCHKGRSNGRCAGSSGSGRSSMSRSYFPKRRMCLRV